MITVHPPETRRTYRSEHNIAGRVGPVLCGLCSRSFRDIRGLLGHLRIKNHDLLVKTASGVAQIYRKGPSPGESTGVYGENTDAICFFCTYLYVEQITDKSPRYGYCGLGNWDHSAKPMFSPAFRMEAVLKNENAFIRSRARECGDYSQANFDAVIARARIAIRQWTEKFYGPKPRYLYLPVPESANE